MCDYFPTTKFDTCRMKVEWKEVENSHARVQTRIDCPIEKTNSKSKNKNTNFASLIDLYLLWIGEDPLVVMLLTSLIGSLIGFYVCYTTLLPLDSKERVEDMRVCMLNSMTLAFLFALLVELTTGSKSLAVIIPFASIAGLMASTMRPFSILNLVELGMSTLMSVSMGVMLLGMIDNQVVWIIQVCLVAMEVLLFTSIRKRKARSA